ncbi:MAG TPA: CBS domain-containing protein [Planctomycetaceae bacterium]|nr:CBS domain-containing protein [Planctomycetaceae bacterium]
MQQPKPKLASEIMISKLHSVQPDEYILGAIRLLVQKRISGAPVVDGSCKYHGMFTDKSCMSVMSSIARQAAQDERSKRIRSITARELMKTRLVALRPEMDVFDAISYLIQQKISGAPVLDSNGEYLGIFSEKGSMDAVIESAYSQLPTSRVGHYMDVDRGRVIDEQTDLMAVNRMFLETPYRRLIVLREGKLLGMISRRDVLACQIRLAEDIWNDGNPSATKQSPELTDTTIIQSPKLREHSPRISEFMDTRAHTITEQHDLLSIAQLFRDLPYRRFPVLCDGKLVGQVSRRDLLTVAHSLMAVKPPAEQNLLYLSSLVERNQAPVTRLIQ